MTSKKQYSNICFTAWEVMTDDPLSIFSYLIVGEEVCPETGRIHYQSYGELKNKTTLPVLKKMLGEKTHIEARRGTQAQAIEYCKKEKKYLEIGERKKQGERNDLRDIYKELAVERVKDVADRHPGQFMRYNRAFTAARSIQSEPEGFVKMTCYLFWGPSGSGKTREAFKMEDVFMLPAQTNGSVWFDGYDGQKTLLIDDYSYRDIPDKLLLKICDGYPLQVPIKGGFVWKRWSRVVFTSNDPFDILFPFEGMDRRLPRMNRWNMKLSIPSDSESEIEGCFGKEFDGEYEGYESS